jgi:AraC-like DNA-binding protein
MVDILNESANSSAQLMRDAVDQQVSLCEAPLARDVGIYREARPDPRLATAFSRRWTHECPALKQGSLMVVPDGCMDLQAIDGTLRIAGPDTRPFHEQLAPGSTVVALRFRPGVAAQWLRISARELVGRRVCLADLIGSAGQKLQQSVAWDDGPAAIRASLERALSDARLLQPRVSPDVLIAVDAIRSAVATGRPSIPRLARLSAASERGLRRHFNEALGYGPTTFSGILRFQYFLTDALSNPKLSLAQLAARAGYADQAHLSRECRRLSGRTPGQLRSPSPPVPGSDC